MYMKQSDLLKGLGKDFLKQVMEVAEKQRHSKGHLLFKEGDRADHLYILLKGRVKITIGETSHKVYSVDHPGEVFGWSCLVGRERYSGSAECRESTTLLRIGIEKLEALFEKNQRSEAIFFRHLAYGLGARLIQSYRMISDKADLSLSYGTGQVQESTVTVS